MRGVSGGVQATSPYTRMITGIAGVLTPQYGSKALEEPSSVKDCVLLCSYHHQVVIHRWGWTLVLNSDGTTTAWNKDKTKDLAKLSRVRSSQT